MSRAFSRTAPAWDWTAQQYADPHTVYLLDPAVEATLAPGDDGLRMGNAAGGDNPYWIDNTSKVAVVSGKFRQGLHPTTASNGIMHMPSAGLFPPVFTWEGWVSASASWAGLSDQSIFRFFNSLSGDSVGLRIHGGAVLLEVTHVQNQAADVNTTVQFSSGIPTDTAFHWLAVTYDASKTVRLMLDGTVKTTTANVIMPGVFGDQMRDTGNGLILCGRAGTGSTSITLSDLRISRIARVLGKPAPLVAL